MTKQTTIVTALLLALMAGSAPAYAQDACRGLYVMTEQSRQKYAYLPDLVEGAVDAAGGQLAPDDRLDSYMAFNDTSAPQLLRAGASQMSGLPAELGVDWVLLVQVRPDKESEAVEHVKVAPIPTGAGVIYQTFDSMEAPGKFQRELKALLDKQFATACKAEPESTPAHAQRQARQPEPAQRASEPRRQRAESTPQSEPTSRSSAGTQVTTRRPTENGKPARENPDQVNYLPQGCEQHYDCAEWASCSPIENLCYVEKGTDIPVATIESDFASNMAVLGVYYPGSEIWGGGIDARFLIPSDWELHAGGHAAFGGNELVSLFMGAVHLGPGYTLFSNDTVRLSTLATLDVRIVSVTVDGEIADLGGVGDSEEFLIDGRSGLRADFGPVTVEADVGLRGLTFFLQAGFNFSLQEEVSASFYE